MASPDGAAKRQTALPVLAAVIAAVLIVAIAAYLIMTAPVPAPPAPFVEFGELAWGDPGDVVVNVSTADAELALAHFRIELTDVYAGTTIFGVDLRSGTLYTDGTVTATFLDATSSGRLGVGDGVRLDNLPPMKTYSLILIYKPESRTVASVTIPL